jgi:non-ribosomal peptide synthetase component F
MIEKMHEITRNDARQPEQPTTLLDLFAEGCLNGTHTAVKYGDTQLSYKQLNARSLNLAHKILALGLEPQTPVAVCLKPCVDVLVAILGIYRSGMIYVPFDPTHPPAYTKHMLDEAEPKLALVTSKTKDFEPIQHMPTWLLDQMPELQGDFIAIQALPPK